MPVEYAVAALIADGDLRRHTLKARVVYRARRDLLAQEIRKALGASVDFDLPNGGLALWLRLGDVDDRLWADRAKEVWTCDRGRLTLFPPARRGRQLLPGWVREPRRNRDSPRG